MSSDPASKDDIERVVNLIQQGADRIDQRFDEVAHRFQEVEHRFEAVENRLDRIGDTLVGVQTQMASMTRWSDRFDREHVAVLGTQHAQQRIIDDLAARVARLEAERKAS